MALGKRDRDFVRGLAGPKHWREDDARHVLSLVAASGLSRAAFARQYGVSTSRLSWWERRLGPQVDDGGATSAAEPTAHGAGAGFVELVAAPGSDAVAARLRVGAVEVSLHRLDPAAAQFVMELARLHEEASCS